MQCLIGYLFAKLKINNIKSKTFLFYIVQSDEEFFSLNSQSPNAKITVSQAFPVPFKNVIPKSFDWRNNLTFNSVENQGHCSSCWAFASATSVEAAYAHQKGMHNLHLSRQELVDCTNRTFDPHYLNYGCKGGWPTEAFKYIMDHGVYEDKVYHYTGKVIAFKCVFCY